MENVKVLCQFWGGGVDAGVVAEDHHYLNLKLLGLGTIEAQG